MADGRRTPYLKNRPTFLAITLQVCPICVKFCTKTQNPTATTVERQKFRILKIRDEGRISNEKMLRTQILHRII